eukprot:2150887-Rhodomonas_salina.1
MGVQQSGAAGEPNLANQDLYTEKAFAILQNLPAVADRFSQQFLEVELLLYASLQVDPRTLAASVTLHPLFHTLNPDTPHLDSFYVTPAKQTNVIADTRCLVFRLRTKLSSASSQKRPERVLSALSCSRFWRRWRDWSEECRRSRAPMGRKSWRAA